jgi:hypothetical protein
VHLELLEIKTPPLRQEQRDRVVAACERRGLLTALQGFGKLCSCLPVSRAHLVALAQSERERVKLRRGTLGERI